MKILIVDDDLEVVRWIGNAFTAILRGYLVLTATTANQGLNLIKEERPEVIIMDVRLGAVSGMDLLEDYPMHTKDYNPAVIVITAYDDEEAKRRAEALKVDAFLPKPLRREVLMTATLKAIRRRVASQLTSIDLALKGFDSSREDISSSYDFLDKKRQVRDGEEPGQGT